jgi:hypothetical protein
MSLSKLNLVEPPWYVTRMPGGVGGGTARCPPIPINAPLYDLHELWAHLKISPDGKVVVKIIQRSPLGKPNFRCEPPRHPKRESRVPSPLGGVSYCSAFIAGIVAMGDLEVSF